MIYLFVLFVFTQPSAVADPAQPDLPLPFGQILLTLITVNRSSMPCEQHICARCAQEDKTCCQTCEIYTTPGDETRIAKFTGQVDFTHFVTPQNPVYLQFRDDPLWKDAVFRCDGTRRILKRQPNGDCRFLGHCGCTLPTDVRPLVCRLYPFDYNEHGIYDKLTGGCPTHLLQPGESLLVALDMNRVRADQWHAQLYQEIRHEPHFQSSGSQANRAETLVGAAGQ